MSAARTDSEVDGLLLVDKPEGPTSHDMVARLRRHLGGARVGHAGTLDPMASGLLVLLVGRATRLAPLFAGHVKTYSGTGRIGFATDTYDRTGRPTGPAQSAAGIDAAALEAAAIPLRGAIEQLPPPFSARQTDGERHYAVARRGGTPVRRPATVQVERFNLRLGPDGRFDFDARVSAGTYIRTLVHDLGERLGLGAHLVALRRLASGPFRVEAATRLERAGAAGGAPLPLPAWIPFDEIPLGLPEATADPGAEEAMRHGRPFPAGDGTAADQTHAIRAVDGRLLGLATPLPGAAGPGLWLPRRVFTSRVVARPGSHNRP